MKLTATVAYRGLTAVLLAATGLIWWKRIELGRVLADRQMAARSELAVARAENFRLGQDVGSASVKLPVSMPNDKNAAVEPTTLGEMSEIMNGGYLGYQVWPLRGMPSQLAAILDAIQQVAPLVGLSAAQVDAIGDLVKSARQRIELEVSPHATVQNDGNELTITLDDESRALAKKYSDEMFAGIGATLGMAEYGKLQQFGFVKMLEIQTGQWGPQLKQITMMREKNIGPRGIDLGYIYKGTFSELTSAEPDSTPRGRDFQATQTGLVRILGPFAARLPSGY